jgi:hypothetical protein
MLIIDLMNESPERRFSIYQGMATAIVEHTRKHGGCLPQDLLQHGFTKEQTLELWHISNAMARIELKLMEGQSLPECSVEKSYA